VIAHVPPPAPAVEPVPELDVEALADAIVPDEPDEFEEYIEDLREREELLEAEPEPVVELPAVPPAPPGPTPKKQGALFGAPGADGALLDEAAELVVEYRRASANFLRRRLRISLDEAKDVLAALAERGIIECEPGAGHGRVIVDR